ncbi:hypothetical protein A2U01_0074147, partial [Trifolium medium]|nr:hypothetical protein [Trifolium medium]
MVDTEAAAIVERSRRNHRVVHAFRCESDCFSCGGNQSGCSSDDWSAAGRNHPSPVERQCAM